MDYHSLWELRALSWQWEFITTAECDLMFFVWFLLKQEILQIFYPSLKPLNSQSVSCMKERTRILVRKSKCFSTYWSCEYWCCNTLWWKPDIQTEGGRRFGIKYRSPSVGFCVGVWWWRHWVCVSVVLVFLCSVSWGLYSCVVAHLALHFD